ncbi:hypothetical protein [Echinicola rosea]|uniref:hypothetical protein n=1 Tax=Echinicola rosea TaxID=1807691 RepID=UPI0016657BC0|nr:hypothetical protein [Echinicola rosea]
MPGQMQKIKLGRVGEGVFSSLSNGRNFILIQTIQDINQKTSKKYPTWGIF